MALAWTAGACGGSRSKGKAAPPPLGPPKFDAQWQQYENKLAELQKLKAAGKVTNVDPKALSPMPVENPTPVVIAPVPNVAPPRDFSKYISTETSTAPPPVKPAAPAECPAGPVSYGPRIDAQIHDAKELIYAKNYSGAVDQLSQILTVQPENAGALEILGSAQYMAGHSDLAKAAWERAYKVDPCRKEILPFLEALKGKTP